MKRLLLTLSALLFSASSLAATPWQQIQQPISGAPQSIGGFANGCLVGARALPLNSPHYQVMRQDQRRYFGHPDLIQFIQRLSTQVHNLQLGNLLIGDMGMAAGGRFSSGHASHQTGLDVDIWLQLPKTRWSAQQLLKPQPLDLVGPGDKNVIARHWQPEIDSLIKLAAKDDEVTRIFVNPAIKNSSVPMPVRIATGCVKCVRGLPTAPICMCVYAVRLAVSAVKISPRHHKVMAVAQSYRAGFCRKNPAPVRQ